MMGKRKRLHLSKVGFNRIQRLPVSTSWLQCAWSNICIDSNEASFLGHSYDFRKETMYVVLQQTEKMRVEVKNEQT